MELFQVFWDDQKKLFLEFKKNKEENPILLPEKIKRLNLKFEISKKLKHSVFDRHPPYLVSIKKLYYSSKSLSFSIDLDEIRGYNDLQIKILCLIIFLYSGQRIEYIFKEIFNVSDIWINEDCYSGFQYTNLGSKKGQKSVLTKEKLFQEVKTDYNQKQQERTIIYEKNRVESIPLDQSLISMISESNDTLKNIEQQLRNLNMTLQNMSFSNKLYKPPISNSNRRFKGGIERIKGPSEPSLIQSQASSVKLMVVKEMKSLFKENIEKNVSFNVKDILRPLTEEELKSIILDDDVLMKKEEEAIKNQIKRFKKQNEKKFSLETLKKPK